MKLKIRTRTEIPEERPERRRRESPRTVDENAKAYYVMIMPFVGVIIALGFCLFLLVNWIVTKG